MAMMAMCMFTACGGDDKDEDLPENDYKEREDEDDDDTIDDDKISEEIYRTQLDEDPVELSDDLNLEDEEGDENY